MEYMDIQHNFGQLLETEMDRKGFLMYIATIVVSLIGLNALIRALTHPITPSHHISSPSSAYGQSPYGGKKSV
jgi:hypothetical protein